MGSRRANRQRRAHLRRCVWEAALRRDGAMNAGVAATLDTWERRLAMGRDVSERQIVAELRKDVEEARAAGAHRIAETIEAGIADGSLVDSFRVGLWGSWRSRTEQARPRLLRSGPGAMA